MGRGSRKGLPPEDEAVWGLGFRIWGLGLGFLRWAGTELHGDFIGMIWGLHGGFGVQSFFGA